MRSFKMDIPFQVFNPFSFFCRTLSEQERRLEVGNATIPDELVWWPDALPKGAVIQFEVIIHQHIRNDVLDDM